MNPEYDDCPKIEVVRTYTQQELEARVAAALFAARQSVAGITVHANHMGPEWNRGYATGINNASKTLEMLPDQFTDALARSIREARLEEARWWRGFFADGEMPVLLDALDAQAIRNRIAELEKP